MLTNSTKHHNKANIHEMVKEAANADYEIDDNDGDASEGELKISSDVQKMVCRKMALIGLESDVTTFI